MAEYGESLSAREMDVLAQLKLGASNKEIAQNLFISSNTVKVHLRNINTKLGASSRTEALARALEQGLLTITAETQDEPEPTPADALSPEANASTEPTTDEKALSSESTTTQTTPEQAEAARIAPTQSPSKENPAPAPTQRVNIWLIGVILLLTVSLLLIIIIPRFGGIGTADVNNPPLVQDEQIDNTEWYQTSPLPVPRIAANMTTVGSNLYLFGGLDEMQTVQNGSWRFSIEDRTWSPIQNKPTAVSHAASAELTGFVYVIGGNTDENGTRTDNVEVYSPVRDLWRAAADLPQPLSQGVAISDDRSIYYIGGQNSEQISDLIYQYDEVSDSWRTLATLPESMPDASAVLRGNRLYIMGGSATAACYHFDLTTAVWDSCAPLPEPYIINGKSFVIKDKIYLFGGNSAESNLIYDPQNDSWSTLSPPLTLPNGSAVAQIETQIYFFGGEIDGAPNMQGYRYAPLVHQWFLPNVSIDSTETDETE